MVPSAVVLVWWVCETSPPWPVMASYTSLRAWQVAHQLAIEVARATSSFPQHERFELTSQLRRAALSIPTNLVEGRARFGPREYLRFVRIAAGSCAEVDYLLYFAREMTYLSPEQYAHLDQLRRSATRLIGRLARSLTAPPASPLIALHRPPSP
jgi:four helix bundle protein